MAQFFWAENSPFFTQSELECIHTANSEFETRPVSFVTRAFMPLWTLLSTKVLGENVAPNAITLVGLLSSIQAFQLTFSYYRHTNPGDTSNDALRSIKGFGVRGAGYGGSVGADELGDFLAADRTVQTATVLVALLLVLSIACGSLDGVHAKRCRLATSVGDIFSRVCSSLSRIFTALTLLEILGIHDTPTRWYALLSVQLIEFNTVLGRINANNIKKDKVKNWAYVATYCFRESELSFLMLMLLAVRWCVPEVVAAAIESIPAGVPSRCYWALLATTFVNVGLLKMRKRFKSSIALCLAARALPVFYLLPLNGYNSLSLIGDAMVVGLLSVEVYVSHLANRRPNAAVAFLCIFSLLNDVFAITGAFLYIAGQLATLSFSLNVPLFVPVRNVYIDGVFDLCHAGHKIAMRNALKHGNRLIVGVCGDEECTGYKRRPIMTTAERVHEVELCKYVSEVIPNAPVSGITEAMIKKYNVHVVVCGEEYDTPTDTYYALPRRLGILKTVPRTDGISTSVLINRIRAARDDDVVAKDKASGKSTVKDGS